VYDNTLFDGLKQSMSYKDYALRGDLCLLEAIEALERIKGKGLVIVDIDYHLIGTLTDGDIRRYLLKGGCLNDESLKAANRSCKCFYENEINTELYKNSDRSIYPVLNRARKVVGVRCTNEDVGGYYTGLIMAGGLGTRLRPLTYEIPKPLLKINGTPMIERIIRGMEKSGIKEIYVSVRYLAEMITSYLGDGSRYGVELEYIYENEPLGTAGAMRNLPDIENIVVCNGDIVTDLCFNKLIDYYRSSKATITAASRLYEISVPFGVLDLSIDKIVGIKEKPEMRFPVAAGIYAIRLNDLIENGIIDRNSEVQAVDMPDVLQRAVIKNMHLNTFILHEDWHDIGTIEAYSNICKG